MEHILELYRDAAFYDVEFAARRHEIPFLLQRGRAAGAGARILEVACGTGRLTLPLAREGYALTGLDLSPEMLLRAEAAAAAEGLRVRWVEGDCREMCLGERYDLVFMLTNALQHLDDHRSVLRFFARVREHLAPGGRLVFDAFNPDPAKLARTAAGPYRQKSFPDAAGREVAVEAASAYDRERQRLHLSLRYRRGGELIKTKEVTLRCFFPQELLALCEWGGLEVVEHLGGYAGEAFTADSTQQVLVCRAGGGEEVPGEGAR